MLEDKAATVNTIDKAIKLSEEGKVIDSNNFLIEELGKNNLLEGEKIWFQVAINYMKLQKHQEAYEALLKSNQIKENSEAYSLLGELLFQANKFQEAHDILQKAIALNNQDFMSFRYLGMIYFKTQHLERAIQAFLNSLQLNPKQEGLNFIVASILSRADQYIDAYQFCKKEMDLGPLNPEQNKIYAQILFNLGLTNEAAGIYHLALKAAPRKAHYSKLLLLAHHAPKYKPHDFKNIAEECYEICLKPFKELHSGKIKDFKNTKQNDRKIKIAFLSPRFRFAAADYWACRIIKNFDREKFEVFLYHDNHVHDEGTQDFIELADHWKELPQLSHEDLAVTIREDEIDILVDMVGHMIEARLETISLKPAPVQVSWLNYFGTVGMPEIDYFIADKHVVNQNIENNFIEKIYKMPNFFNPYFPKGLNYDLPLNNKIPYDDNGFITLGSFNRFPKINNEVIKVWSDILTQSKDTKLIIASKATNDIKTQEFLNEEFKKNNIDSQRVKYLNYPENIEDFFKLYYEIDFHLEAFPFAGGATSLDCLYMGVPIVSIAGDTWVYRSGVSLLHASNCSEFVVDSLEDYIPKVLEMIEDTDKLRVYRTELRERILNSPICDHEQYSKDFQAAFKKMWQDYCES